MEVLRIIVRALLITSMAGARVSALEFKETVVELTYIYDFRTTIICSNNDIKATELAGMLLGRESPVESIPKLVWNQEAKTDTMFNTNILNIAFVLAFQ